MNTYIVIKESDGQTYAATTWKEAIENATPARHGWKAEPRARKGQPVTLEQA